MKFVNKDLHPYFNTLIISREMFERNLYRDSIILFFIKLYALFCPMKTKATGPKIKNKVFTYLLEN